MGMRPPKMCAKCHRVALPSERYCAAHKVSAAKRDRNQLRPLYKCKRWRVTRIVVLDRDTQCTVVEHGTRCLQLSTDVHHVIDALEWVANGGDFYDTDNLQGMCHAHHSSHTARTQGFAQRRT
jgi:hypothetical protein